MAEVSSQALNYVTTNLFEGRASNAGSFAMRTPAHTNMQYHQIIMVASAGLATGAYKVRFMASSGENQLEYTAYTGKILLFTGGRSAIAHFSGQLTGIHLELSSAFPAGQTVSCVLSSSTLPFDATDDVVDGAVPDTSVPLEGWRDLRMALVAAATGAGAPASAAFGPTGGVKQLSFGVGDSVYVAGHVDHDVKVGSTFYPHMHWAVSGTDTASVRWQITYTTAKGHNQESFGADTVVYLEEAAQGTAWRHMVTEDSVGFPALEVDSLFVAEIKRISNGGVDNANTVFGLFMDIHYEVQQYATPSRVPDFYS